jgi:hypothetical protein
VCGELENGSKRGSLAVGQAGGWPGGSVRWGRRASERIAAGASRELGAVVRA